MSLNQLVQNSIDQALAGDAVGSAGGVSPQRLVQDSIDRALVASAVGPVAGPSSQGLVQGAIDAALAAESCASRLRTRTSLRAAPFPAKLQVLVEPIAQPRPRGSSVCRIPST